MQARVNCEVKTLGWILLCSVCVFPFAFVALYWGKHNHLTGIVEEGQSDKNRVTMRGSEQGYPITISSTKKEWRAVTASPSLIYEKLVLDIMSVGSKTRPEHLQAQKEIFESDVRNFLAITEDDDMDQECQKLTAEDATRITEYCLDERRIQAIADMHPILAKMQPYFNGNNPDKPGWLCAQKRPIDGLRKVLRRYDEAGTTFPDYLLIVDDDTFLSIPAISNFLEEAHSNSSEPVVMAGCLDRVDSSMGIPWGGFGTFLSKAALNNLVRPIECSLMEEDNFVGEACQQIENDLFGEKSVFRDGMSMIELIQAYASAESFFDYHAWTDQGFCVQSDWVWGYFFNFYPISGRRSTQILTDGVEQKHRMHSYQNSKSSYLKKRKQYFDHDLSGQCEFDGDEYCGAESHICHYMTPEGMHRVVESVQQHQSVMDGDTKTKNDRKSRSRAEHDSMPKKTRNPPFLAIDVLNSAERALKTKSKDAKSPTYRDPKSSKSPKMSTRLLNRLLKTKSKDASSPTYRDPKSSKSPKMPKARLLNRSLKTKTKDANSPTYRDPKSSKSPKMVKTRFLNRSLKTKSKDAKSPTYRDPKSPKTPKRRLLVQTKIVTPVQGTRAQRPVSKDYVVKAIIMPTRADEARKRLDGIFPHVDYVAGYDKENLDLGLMESAGTYDKEWDDDEYQIRDALLQDYSQKGEVACTLSHRRALEKFLQEDSKPEVALLLEDDTAPVSPAILDEIDNMLSVAPSGWEFIQLGRCWDIWCDKDETNDPVALFSATNTGNSNGKKISLYHSRGFELCSHAYLITRNGAKKVLQHTLPVLLPYDHTLMLLGREGILDEYFTSPRMFVQLSNVKSIIQNKKVKYSPECNPEGEEIAKDLSKNIEVIDPYLMSRILDSPAQNMISWETRRLKHAPDPTLAEVGRDHVMSNLCKEGNFEFCESMGIIKAQTAEHCRILGGLSDGDESVVPSEPSRSFLMKLDAAGLDGVVIWGLQPDQNHSHRHVHISLHSAVEEAMMSSKRKRHLCYVKETPGFHLGRDLYGDESRGKMGKSLVFASPKHMTWSDDPGFLTLPIEKTSRYIFHGETPRPHTALKRMGLAVEWEAWGPDGNVPIIDSDNFVRGDTWRPTRGCAMDEKQKTFHCPNERLIVQPWASEYTHNQILSNMQNAVGASQKDRTTTLHFVGTIWSCNIQEFIEFVKGCSDFGIDVVRLGQWILNTNDERMSELAKLPNFSIQTMPGLTKEDVFNNTRGQTMYAPAFQGSCHLLQDDPSYSYVADRILNLISIGVYPMTNNPSSFEYLGKSEAIAFNSNTSQLCGSMMDHQSSREGLIDLMGIIARSHTYVSRLSVILDFLLGPLPLNTQLSTLEDDYDFIQLLKVALAEQEIRASKSRDSLVNPLNSGELRESIHEESSDADSSHMRIISSTADQNQWTKLIL